MIDKACVTSAGRVIGEITVKDVAGVDCLVRVQDGAGKKGQGELELRAAKEKFTFDTIFDVVNPTIAAQATVKVSDKVTAGASAKFDTKYDDDKSPMQFTDYDVALAYKQVDLTAVLQTKSKFSELQLSVFHDVSNTAQVAAQCNFKSKGDAKEVSMVGGAIYAIDNDSKLQVKLDSKGLASANYIQVIKPGVKGIASVQLDTLNFAGDSHQFGLSLILG